MERPSPVRSLPATPSSLRTFFEPRTIAVVGATEREGSVGRAVLENLAEFPGRVFPVNPRRATVLGRPAYSRLSDVPEEVDLAVIVTPAPTVPAVIRDCVAARVPAAVILSAGFREAGPEGAARERDILAAARDGGLRIIGPNCLGVMSPHGKCNATFAADIARPGSVAFISQSGALCTAILDWSFRENVGFSGFVSVGSMLDVGWADLIRHFGDDPRTRSIVCYMESVGDGPAFLAAARAVTPHKPIIVIKVGRTAAAARAAASHTGALTGSDDVLDAVFRRAGVLRVNTIDELFAMAEVLAKQPRPRGPRLAIVTNAGGPGALSTDMLIRSGGQLAEISPESRAAFEAVLPAHWSHGNPVDILGDADAERYARTVEILARDPQNDGLLVILTPQKMTECTGTAERLRAVARPAEKPLLASWMGDRQVAQGETVLNQGGIPTYRDPDQAARSFALMWRYTDSLRLLREPIDYATDPSSPRVVAAGALLRGVRESGRTLLTEPESKELLAAYGIPVVETRAAATADEAVAGAEKMGFPVVLKILSETITHKSDVGGVQLDLRDAAAVRQAWRSIRDAVTERAGRADFLGCTVQPMVSSEGCELILGSSRDPQFGPVLLFGAGGRWVEFFRDRALALAPLTAALARRLMEQTKIYGALLGRRGQKPVDLAALEQLLIRFSHLVLEQPAIKEIDINPLLASAEGMVALDARVLLQAADEAVGHPAEAGA